MDFITPFITPIVESLMAPVKKHLGFFVSSTKHVTEMGTKMEQLNAKAQDIQERKDTNLANNYVLPKEVSLWLEDARKTNEKAETIPTARIGCFNVAKRYKAGKQSSDILKKIVDLETRASNIDWTKEIVPLGIVGSSTSTGPSTSNALVLDGAQNDFKSRDLIFKKAMKFLQDKDEKQKMMALCGMGGVGKTTMMEQLKKEVEDSKMFDWVVKVVIGENVDLIALQKAISQYIGEALTEDTIEARANRLNKKFKGMSQDGHKKILIIMDDLWKEVDLKDVGLTSPLPNGLKLLFTSRLEDVCYRMGVKHDAIFKVGVLNDAEAKALFFETVSLPNGDDLELQKIGEDIAKRCGGLPIAIVTIAKSLIGNIKEAWEVALSRLERHDLKDLDSIVREIFEMSFNNLKEDEDKSVFLLCGLFPDDFNIPTEDLLRYGWGLGFFKPIKTLAAARRHMKICVNNLIHANLLIESDSIGCVKMHDLVRAFALSKFSKVKQASIINHDNISGQLTQDTNNSYERILLKCTGMSKFPTDFIYPNLSLLILMDGDKRLKFRKNIYQTMKKLEVISFENMGIPLLPIAFDHSTRLRTLYLRSCILMDDISFLGSLSNLETLSFANCYIRRLPSAIGKLTKLKLLDLTGCVHLCIDDGVFQNLVNLEELYMRVYKSKAIRFTYANCDELKTLSQGLSTLEMEFFENKAQPKNVSFKKLERFRISIGCELKCENEKYSFKNTLKLLIDRNELLDCKINELFEKTEELLLQVNDMYHLEDVVIAKPFSNLRDLEVCKCADLTCLFTISMVSGLKKLERLKVTQCRVLKVLVGENREDIINIIELPQLVELILDGLPRITSIYPDNTTSTIESFFNKKVMLPKLQKLTISSMDNLKQIWPFQMTSTEKSNVSMLTVRECDSLVNLFPSNPLPLLNHLEVLQVEYCNSVEVLFNMDFKGVCEMKGYTSMLRSIKVEKLMKLKELWRMRGINKSDIISGFKGVERIEIKKCYMFTNICTPTTANFDLGALTTYIFERLGDLEEREKNKELAESSQEINVTSKGEISKLMDGNIPNVTHTFQLLHTCHHLQHLDIRHDERVKVAFELDDSRHQQLLLPYLKVLNLNYLDEMSHVWKCNWNKFLIPQQSPLRCPFQNLTDISLYSCNKIKYLFSPLMAKFLSNLKSMHISVSDSIEEVVSSRDGDENNATSSSSHTNNTLFPHLDILSLADLPSLKRINGVDTTIKSINDQFQGDKVIGDSWSLCQYPREIQVWSCNALSSIIPWYAAGQMKRLEKLEIYNCKRIIEVFESQRININTNTNSSNSNIIADEGSASASGTTLTSPRLKDGITLYVPILSNLKVVSISKCELLPHVFTLSTLESLNQLKELTVFSCEAIQVIIKEDQFPSSKVVVFPRLQRLHLKGLPKLEGFFLGVNDFRWPLLDDVMIEYCPKMRMLTSGQSKTPKLKYISTSSGKHSLEHDLKFHGTTNQHAQGIFPSLEPNISEGLPLWSYHNFIELDLSFQDFKMFIIPSDALLQLQKLEKINLGYCNGIEEVFEGRNENESQMNVVEIPNLREVTLVVLKNLKYIWKSNEGMVLQFPNLTTLFIECCNRLEHVFTSSMVGSLVQLQHLSISKCDNIEVVVKEEEIKDDANVNENIMLPRLKSLKLERLESLKGFYLGKEAFSCPLLDNLEIYKCRAIEVFTKGHLDTPELQVIETSPRIMYDVNRDLNSFIKTEQAEGVFA